MRQKGILAQTVQFKQISSELGCISFICMKEDALSPEKSFQNQTVFSLCVQKAWKR